VEIRANTTSAQRTGAPDTDSNGADFTADLPTPGEANATTGGGTGTGDPGPLRIHDIQGAGWISPQNSQAVVNVPGIVTGVRATGSSRGFWMQDPTPDANPATSEGIFVFTTPTVAVGDSVLVSGKVSDFYPLSTGETVSTTSNLSTTEIGTATTIKLTSGNELPPPVMLTPTTVPGTYAPDLGGGSIESTPITPARSALDFYESVEAMRVQVDNAPASSGPRTPSASSSSPRSRPRPPPTAAAPRSSPRTRFRPDVSRSSRPTAATPA
jgi:predicted extracellular nuclease